MTLGIAAICEQGSSAVMVADRMVSTGIAGLELESENRKLIRLYPQTMVATTGNVSDARFALDIFQGLADLSGAASTAQVAEHLRSACEQLRMQQAETMFIRRLFGIGLAEFREKCLSTRANKVITDIYNKIAGHNLGLEFLLACANRWPRRSSLQRDGYASAPSG